MIAFTIFLKVLGIIIFGLFLFLFFSFGAAFYFSKQKNLIFDFLKAFLFDFLLSILLLFVFPWVRLFNKIFPSSVKRPSTHRLPILLIHGYQMNSNSWLMFIHFLKKLGCSSLYTFEYSPWKSIEEVSELLSEKVAQILQEENKTKLNIIAHSLGGLVSRYWIEKSDGKNKICHLVTLASPHQGGKMSRLGVGKAIQQITYQSEFIQKLGKPNPPAGSSYLAIYTFMDQLIFPVESAKMETLDHLPIKNFSVSGVGHLSILFSRSVIQRISEDFEGC